MALRIFAYMMNRSSYFLFITYNQRLLKFVFRTAIYISMSIYTHSLLSVFQIKIIATASSQTYRFQRKLELQYFLIYLSENDFLGCSLQSL